ncbi:MAG: autotransporter domain-containing protein [Bradyrhizobium sp.]|nr:autotransporter domain-containing protein [Bradyrhizobium sp.]
MSISSDAARAQQYFNGAQTSPNAAINGGGGVWDTTTANWTDATGTVTHVYDASAGTTTVFGASGASTPSTGGTVTVTAGGIQLTSNVQFSGTADFSPYTIQGGALTLASGGTIFNVSTGIFAFPSGIINSNIVGNDGVTVTGSGVLALGGTNTYSRGTLVSGSPLSGVALQVTNNNAVGTGPVTLENGIFQAGGVGNLTFMNSFKVNSSALGGGLDANGVALTIAGNISGTGLLTIFDSSFFGKVVLTGTNTYTGGTFICSCATLQLGDVTHMASIVGNVTNEGLFNIINANTTRITSITNDASFGSASTTFASGTSASSMAISNVNGGRTFFIETSSAGQSNITNTNGGITQFGRLGSGDRSTAGNATIDNSFGGGIFFQAKSDAGTADIANHNGGGVLFRDHANGATSTIINNSGGSTQFNAFSSAGSANLITNNGGQLGFFNHSDAGSAVITTNSGGFVQFFDNADGQKAQFITNGTGYVDFGQSVGPNSDGVITAGSIAGSGRYYIGGGNTLVVGGNNLSTTVSGVISDNNPCGCTSGSGSLQKVGSGTLTLSGLNTYTGTTAINGGFLDVEGSIASSSLTSVNAGGALTGAGIVGNTTIANGGIFVPGNGFGTSTTVQGNLAFQSGALYLVQLNSTASTFANVSGTASLNGNVGVALDPASGFIMKKYMILQAGGGVSGAFSGVSTPSNFASSVTYDPTHAYLNLNLNYGANASLNANQQNVANTLSNFFNANGGISAVLASLTPSGLSQASGEIATGTQQATFNAMNMFMQLLSDPFVSGRSGGTATGGGAQPYAEEDDSLAYAARRSGSARDALAKMPTKADVARNDLLDNRWSVWGSAFGGGANISGNAALGSNTADTRAFGLAAGADYRITPATIAGFALAGGGTNFSVNSFGSGRSDLFQAGAFVRHTVGNAYVTAVAAYGGQEVWTDRMVAATGDHLQANFNTNAWSGRLEGGYRYVTPWMGITPYAAAQFTTLQLPSYAEQVVAGAGLAALSYNAQTVRDSRTELGLRGDRSYALPNGIFTLRGRLAWAHDFNTDRTAASAFQALPGTFFIVNGAAVARDSALTTASAEMKWMNGWAAALTFEGEFSDVYNSYAGKGVVRYTW